jgi:hypothetical protein
MNRGRTHFVPALLIQPQRSQNIAYFLPLLLKQLEGISVPVTSEDLGEGIDVSKPFSDVLAFGARTTFGELSELWDRQ